MENMKSLIIGLFFLALISLSAVASAGTISLTTVSTITLDKVEIEGRPGYKITGQVELSNSGDDVATAVVPELSLERWIWRGPAREIDPGGSETWQVESVIWLEQIKCQGKCSNLELPLRGVLPVRSVVHYQDLAGYPFTAPSVIRLPFDLNGGMKSSIATKPDASIQIRSVGDGQKFTAVVEGRASGIDALWLSFFTTKEFEVSNPGQVVNVSDGRFKASTKINNNSGNDGSKYPVIGVIQWKKGEFQNSQAATSVLELEQLSRFSPYLLVGVGFVILGALLGWILLYRDEG